MNLRQFRKAFLGKACLGPKPGDILSQYLDLGLGESLHPSFLKGKSRVLNPPMMGVFCLPIISVPALLPS